MCFWNLHLLEDGNLMAETCRRVQDFVSLLICYVNMLVHMNDNGSNAQNEQHPVQKHLVVCRSF
jgi:hypothetical protein